MTGKFIPVRELLKQSGGSNQQGQGSTGFVPVQELLARSSQTGQYGTATQIADPKLRGIINKTKSALYAPGDVLQRMAGNTPVHTDLVDDQYISDYIDRSQKYYNDALTDQETGSWENMTNPFSVKERKQRAKQLEEQNASIRTWFEENKEYFEPEVYEENMAYLDYLSEQYNGVNKFYDEVGKLGSQEEYAAVLNRSKWQQQYMNPEMLQGLNRLLELQTNDGSLSEIKGTEQSLQRMAGNIDLKAVKQRIDQLSGMINVAQLKGENTYQLEQEREQLQIWYDSVRYYKYVGKYEGMSYEQLQQYIDSNQRILDTAHNMPDSVWQTNNTTPEQLQDEQEWLQAYAPSKKTSQDYSKENNQRIFEMANDDEYYNRLLQSDPALASAEEASLREKYQIPDSVTDIHAWFVSSAQALRDQNAYGFLRENPDFEEKSQYDPEKGKINPKYKAIGNWYETGAISDMAYAKYQTMDLYEVENYLYLYNTKGRNAANEYLDAIDQELTKRFSEEWQETVSSAVGEHPALGLLSAPASYFLGALSAPEYFGKSLWRKGKEQITGEKQRPVNMSSLGLAFGSFGDNLNSATVQYIQDNYDGAGEMLLTGGYQLSNQAIQMGLQYLTAGFIINAGGSPALAKGITNALMSGSAYTSTVLDVRARGGTDEQAMASGIAAGVFEWLYENYELDQLMKSGDGGFVRSFFRNALSEGFGEGATTFSNSLADMVIMADKSNFALSVEAYKVDLIAKGMSPEAADRQANKMAWLDIAKNVGTDLFMGALGGGLFGGLKGAYSAAQTKKAFGGARSEVLVNNILASDPENKLALQAKEKLDAKKTLSGDMLSRLVAQNPGIATDTLNYIGRAYNDSFTGQSGTQWNAAQGKLLTAIPDDVLSRTADKLGKTALTFDIIELQNDPQAQQAWKNAGLTWEQLGQTYVKMPALRDEIAWRSKYSKMRSMFSEPASAQTAATTQQNAPADDVSSPDTMPEQQTVQQPAVPADNASGQNVTEAQQMVQWAEGAFSRGEITQEQFDGIREAAAAYDSAKTGSPAPEAAVPAGNVSVPDTQPNAAAQPVIPGGNGSTVSNSGTMATGTVDQALTENGPSGTPVPTEGGTFVPAEKPGKVRLKDPFVNDPKELWDMAQRISEITGREIVLFREKPGEHGIHDGYEQGGILHINVLSENPQATIWGHEYCHSFEKTREHESLKKGLRKLFLRKGISMEDQMRAKQAFYKKNGVDIPMDEAGRVRLENEVVAAYTGKLFTSVDDIQAMVEFNPTIIQRLSHWVDSVLAAFGNKNAAERNFLYQAKKLYQKALSGGTALKNQTEYRDTSAEFNARRQELESMLADGQITDEEYENGIAALDEEQLLQEVRTDTKKHSYAGINASTANVGKLDDAKQMLSEGVDAETIRQQTGWFQGADGKWRFEIADSSMDISNKVLNYMTLGELVKHDALFAAYPNLADITVSFQSLPYSTMAQYDKADDHIYIDYLLKNDITYLKDVLIHEIQHVIQGWEDYASGASVEYWKQKIREGFDAKSRTANNLYWNTAGEIEARDAADRRTLSKEERKKRHPNVGGENVVFADRDAGVSHSYSDVQEVEVDDVAISTEDGSLVVNISSRASGLQQYPKGQWAKRLSRMIRNSLAGKSIYAADGDIITVTNRGISELTYGQHTQNLFNEAIGRGDFSKLNVKQFLSEHVLSLIALSRYESWTKNNDPNDSFKKDGLCHRNVTAYIDGIPHNVSILTALNGDADEVEDYGEKFYDIESIDEIKHQTSRSALNETGTKVQATSHKIKMADGMSDKLTVAQKNRIVKNQNLTYSVGEDGGKTATRLAYEEALRKKQTNHSFSPVESAAEGAVTETGEVSDAVAEDTAETAVSRETLNTKARNYLRAAENRLLTEISKALSVPRGRSVEFLRPVIQQISDEYFRTGTVSQEAMDDLFEQAYELGVVQDREFYDQYKHIKDHLRSTAVTLSVRDQADIADFKDFRSRARNMLKIKDEGGVPVDVAYIELHDMAPELFPESITHPADQLQKMYEVADSIRITEQSLKAAHGHDPDFKKWAKHEFEAAIGESFGKLRDIVRYASDGMRKPAERITSAEQAVEAWSKLKNARKTADNAMRKNLLTESDQQKVGRLLRGEITLEHLDPETDNVKGITAVYEAKQEYEDLSRLLNDYKRRIKAEYRSLAEGFLDTVLSWKDKESGFQYSRETMWRNIQDIVPDPVLARKINEEYFFAVNRAEAKSTKFKNNFRNRVRKLQLSRKVEKGNLVSEAHAVQLYGEALDNIRILNSNKFLKTRDGKTLSEWQNVIQHLWLENPGLDHAKIQDAVNEFRKIYDELFSMMNEVRVRNGYEPVNYRQGYFPHFQPGEESVIAQFGKVFGIEQVDVLPTTINGLTHMFKPGTQWFGNTQERLGFATAYDALEGFDRYIEGIAGVIHQTDNIQKLRAFAAQIRYMASDDGIREQVDKVMADDRLTEEEKQVQVADIYEKAPCALSKFVTELDEYTNLLANKKSRLDRTVEALLNRKFYNFMRKWEGRVAANMVGGNLGSALTNFIPLTQAWGRMKSGSMLKGMFGTLKAIWVGDGVESMSDFLTNRRGSDPLIKNWMQKTSNTLGKPMEWIDSFVSGSIIRAAYYQYKGSGMSDQNAMHCADLLAASIMADRSKGATPTLFNSYNPLVKSITQFQLEVNNQLSEVFKDLPRAYRGQRKLLAAAYTKYFIGACLFNLLFQLIAGRKPALDPIDMLWGLGEDIAEGKSAKEVISNFGTGILENLPFTSGLALFGVQIENSRMPVASSIPDIPGMFEDASDGNWEGFFTELQKPITYNLPTGGGGQLAKTYKGVKAFVEGGSYTKDKDGKDILQYPIYNDSTGDFVGNLLKSTVFGKNSTKEGINWVESGFDSTPAKYTAVYKSLLDCGIRDRDAYKFINDYQAITGDDQAAQRRAFVLDSDLNDEAKKVMVGVMLGTDMKTETGNPSAYAKFLDCLDFGLTVDDYLQLRQDGGDVDRFLEFAEAGLEHSDCSKLSVAIGGLEPEEGKKQVSNQQKWRTVIQTVEDPEQQLAALSTMMGDSQYAKCSVACDNGLDPDLWVMMQEVLPMYDKDENGSYNQEEIAKAIDAVGGDLGARAVAGWWGLDIAKGYRHMSKKEKAVLWQLLTGSPSAKNNPYDVKTGEKVLKKYTKLRDDLKDDEE